MTTCHTICPGLNRCNGWCAPLYIQICLSILQIIVILTMKTYDPRQRIYKSASVSKKMLYLIPNIIWNTGVAVLIYYLCHFCDVKWSWIILLAPILINIMVFIIVLMVIMLQN